MSRGQPLITIKQLRARLENLRIPKYKFCAVIDTHPSNLSNILSGKLPLPPDLARKILVALALEEGRDG